MKKNCFIASVIVMAFISASCVSIKDREITVNERASTEVIGSVEVEFTSFQWFHFHQKEELKRKSYLGLMEEAEKNYEGEIDIRNMKIIGYSSGWEVGYSMVLPIILKAGSNIFYNYNNILLYLIFNGVNILGNFQNIVATADVVRYDPESGAGANALDFLENIQEKNKPDITASSEKPDKKTVVGFNANPAGLMLYGSSVCVEFTKGRFNSEMNFILPSGLVAGFNPGFGFIGTFNGFWPSRIGGFYLGGGGGYVWQKDSVLWIYNNETNIVDLHFLTWGLNLGYKFITNSGMYYRLGSYIGMGYDFGGREMNYFYAKPDLSIGWTMR